MSSWHLVEQGGGVRSAGAAFPPLFRLLPGGSPLAALTARVPDATDRAYRWVAGNRSRWGRFVTDGAKRRPTGGSPSEASPRPRPGAGRGT